MNENDVKIQPSDDELFSVEKGAVYFGGDMDGYHHILADYVEAGPGKLERIGRLLEEESWKNYVIEVHALKSTSLSIGSRTLSQAAAKLESAGKSEDYDVLRRDTAALLDLYRKVLALGEEELARYREETGAGQDAENTGPLEEIGAEALRGYAERLLQAADDFDSGEIEAVCGELAGFTFEGGPLADRFAPVRKAGDNFEYETVDELVRRIMEELLKEAPGQGSL